MKRKKEHAMNRRLHFLPLMLSLSALVAAPASGQQLSFEALNAQTFHLAPDGGKFITTHDTDTIKQYGLRVGLGMNYSENLLVVREDRQVKRGVIKNLLTTDVMLAFGIVDILQFDMAFPFHAYAKLGYVERADTFTTNYPGDLRLGSKVKILDRREYPVGLGLRGYLNAPTGKDERYLGDEKVGGGFQLISDLELEAIYFGLNFGYHIRDEAITPDQTIDDQLTFGAATNLRLTNHFELVFDVFGSTVAKEAFKGTFGNPVEGSAGGKVYLDSGYAFSFGAGRGMTAGFGAAPWRLHASILWTTPQHRDRDGDGIPDHKDQCPGEPEDFDGYMDWDGCPDLDRDGDGIPDDVDVCPDVPEDHDGFQDDDGCPDYDNDGDGIPDEVDECPNEPETFNNYLDHDGCPDVAEILFRGKVVDEVDGNGLTGTIKITPAPENMEGGELRYRNGDFEIKFTDAKVYEFEFTSPGYLPEVRKFSMGGGQSFDVRIKLKRDTRGVQELQQEQQQEPAPADAGGQ